eukprot:jgi/Hompol1/2148/HPOL_005888-RA
MAFIKNQFDQTSNIIEPVITTKAIIALEKYLGDLFKATNPDRKSTVVTCFDTFGSGKTATVAEATRRIGASRIVISATFSPALQQVLKGCRRHPFEDDNGLISRSDVEQVFKDKFYYMLVAMFGTMKVLVENNPNERFDEHVDKGNHNSPQSNPVDVKLAFRDSYTAFESLCEALQDRQLVIHVDDCQLFFQGIVPSIIHSNTTIKKGQVMTLALRSFCRCITMYARSRNIVWVFSGTRPTLFIEIAITSGLETIDISDLMTDFDQTDAYTVLSNYYCFDGLTPDQAKKLLDCCSRLEGPPKNVQIFLKAASKYSLTSVQDLLDSWDRIEDDAVAIFTAKVESTFHGDLDITARNLALLHAISLASSGSDFVEVLEVSRLFIFLIEAGLLRIRIAGACWKVFVPNRLLVRILHRHVGWYTWENIAMLRSCVQSPLAVHTHYRNGFEYLFALELCDSAIGRLWTFLREKTGLVPLASWSPMICHSSDINDCNDTKGIYIMQDSDHSNNKSSVIFFATEKATGESVRVLVQLTLASCGTSKITQLFDGMLALRPLVVDGEAVKDYRLFFGPKCKSDPESDSFYQKNYAENRCQAFTSCSGLQDAFDFDIGVICNPRATDAAVEQLIRMAEGTGQSGLFNQITDNSERLSDSNKRSRALIATRTSAFDFVDMNGFYEALKGMGLDEEEIAIIRAIFDKQHIKFSILPLLTDSDLEKYGIEQAGLRMVILDVLGN